MMPESTQPKVSTCFCCWCCFGWCRCHCFPDCCSDFCAAFCDYVWLFVRLVYTFTAAEAAVVALVVLVNIVLQLIYRLLLPGVDNIPEEVSADLVTIATVFFLLFFLPPCLFDVVPGIVRFIKDSWVEDESPQFLVACNYIRFSDGNSDYPATTLQEKYGKLSERDKANVLCTVEIEPGRDTQESQEGDKITGLCTINLARRENPPSESTECACCPYPDKCMSCPKPKYHQVIRIWKGLLVFVMVMAFAICSIIRGLFAGIQLLFMIGMWVQVAALFLWIFVVLVFVKIAAIYRKNLVLPECNWKGILLYVPCWKNRYLANDLSDDPPIKGNWKGIFICVSYVVVWAITTGLFIESMSQTGSSARTKGLFFVIHFTSGLWSLVLGFGRVEITKKNGKDSNGTKTDQNQGGAENLLLQDMNGIETGQENQGGAANTNEGDTVIANDHLHADLQEERLIPDVNVKENSHGTETYQNTDDQVGAANTKAAPVQKGSKQSSKEELENKEKECLATLLAEPSPKWCCAVRFVQFVFVVLVVGASVLVLVGAARTLYSPKSNCIIATSSQTKRSITDTTMHDICSKTWNNLDILHLAELAKAAYEDSKAVESGNAQNCGVGVAQYLSMTLHNSDWTVVNSSKPEDGAVFYELRSENNDVTVIAIRGTSGAFDALQDADFWSEAALFQLFSTIIPITSILPDETFRRLVDLASKFEFALDAPARRYFTGLEKYIERRLSGLNKLNKEKVLITGHSLGGGLSKMAGARFGIRSFSFNGPGILYSRGKVGSNGVSLEDINRSVVNVDLQGDVVSLIDRLGGSIHRLKCYDGGPINCHKMNTVLKELRKQCKIQ